jgi:hypothetical protein
MLFELLPPLLPLPWAASNPAANNAAKMTLPTMKSPFSSKRTPFQARRSTDSTNL